MIKLVISDVDGTLTRSRQPIDKETADLIAEILKTKFFCIISGGDENLLYNQFRPLIERKDFNEKNFFISSTSGSSLFDIKNSLLGVIYKNHLNLKEKVKIKRIINAIVIRLNLKPITKDSGPLVEDRGAQITLSCLGHQAPLNLKRIFDPNRIGRTIMLEFIHSQKKIDTKGLTMRIGGTTSIDFTREGIDKKYGIIRLLNHLGISRKETIFFGDKTDRNGNDFIDNYVKTVQVNNISQTKEYFKRIIDERLSMA